MAQTTGAMNSVNGKVEISANGTDWFDISGSANKVENPTQEADTGEAATLEGNYMIGTVGKIKPVDLAITVLYTQITGEAYDRLRDQLAVAGRPVWLRWSPAGGNSGDERFFTANAAGALAAGKLATAAFPGADASQAAPVMLMFKVRATTIGVETI